MGVPLQTQLFDAFLGEQEGIHSIILPDIFSSGGAKNLYIDKYGRAKKIDGYAKQNAAAITTNIGASAVLGRGLFHYKKTSGASTTRVEFVVLDDTVDEWEIWRSTDSGITWSFVVDLGASSVGKIPDFAQFGDSLYMTNGVMAPRVTSDGTTISTAGSTQSPTPTASASASSGTLSGVYQWKLVSVKSNKSRGYGSVSSGALNLASKQASLTWTADSDVTVIGYEVYRTTGNGAVFYYVDYVDGRTTAAYADNISDLTILSNRVLQEHGDPPPTSYFCEPHKQRMWWLRSDTYPTRGWFSDPALPDSVLQASNYIDFSDSETVGDVIVGAVGNYEGQLVVFTERAVWKVSGTGQVIGNIVDWTRIRTNAQIGAVSHRAVARIPAGSKYIDQEGKKQATTVVTLAYLTPFGDIRIFDGDNDIIISLPVKTDLAALSYANRQKAYCVTDTVRSEVSWVFPSSAGGSEPATAVVWNYRWGVWYQRDWAFGHAIEADDASNAQLMLGVSSSTTTGGFVYKLWSGNSFAGTAILAQWMTKTLYGVNEQAQPAMSNTKRFRWADLLFETQQTVTLTIEWLPGNTPDNGAAYGTTTVSPAAIGLLAVTGERILDGSGDHPVLSQASTLARALLVNSRGRYLHDTGMRLRVGDNASLGSWSLEALTLAYQIMPGLERRMQG